MPKQKNIQYRTRTLVWVRKRHLPSQPTDQRERTRAVNCAVRVAWKWQCHSLKSRVASAAAVAGSSSKQKSEVYTQRLACVSSYCVYDEQQHIYSFASRINQLHLSSTQLIFGKHKSVVNQLRWQHTTVAQANIQIYAQNYGGKLNWWEKQLVGYYFFFDWMSVKSRKFAHKKHKNIIKKFITKLLIFHCMTTSPKSTKL